MTGQPGGVWKSLSIGRVYQPCPLWTDAERELLVPYLLAIRAGRMTCRSAARELVASHTLKRTEGAITQQLKHAKEQP